MKCEKILVVLPAYNEEKVIKVVIANIKKIINYDILVVDDCSSDKTYTLLNEIKGIFVLRHIINRGAGAASVTGIEFAKRKGYDKVILMDSDGQHDPKDILKLVQISKRYDVVVGSRMIGDISDMPLQRRLANFIGSLVTFFFFSKFVWDSQSGFKILNKKAMSKIKITLDRYEFCSEMIGEIYKNRLKFKEVPIKTKYSNHSLKKGHGQSILNGVKMVITFILK